MEVTAKINPKVISISVGAKKLTDKTRDYTETEIGAERFHELVERGFLILNIEFKKPEKPEVIEEEKRINKIKDTAGIASKK